MNDCSCSTGLCNDCARDMREGIRRVLRLHRTVTRRSLQVCEVCTVPEPCATVQSLGGAASLRDD